MSSDSESFVAASTDGSLTIFKNGKAFRTVKLQGEKPLVRYNNGEIISAAPNGKLTVLNRKLEILKTFHGTGNTVYTLTGHKYIAFGDDNGTIRYDDRVGSIFPRVSGFSRD